MRWKYSVFQRRQNNKQNFFSPFDHFVILRFILEPLVHTKLAKTTFRNIRGTCISFCRVAFHVSGCSEINRGEPVGRRSALCFPLSNQDKGLSPARPPPPICFLVKCQGLWGLCISAEEGDRLQEWKKTIKREAEGREKIGERGERREHNE